MSLRLVDAYKNSNEYVVKHIPLTHKLDKPYEDISDVVFDRDNLTPREYLMIYQSYNELDIYDGANTNERKILAPIIESFYDDNNCLALVYPRFTPLAGDWESMSIPTDEVGSAIASKGFNLTREEINNFLEAAKRFAEDYDLSPEDSWGNLSNVGYSPIFGLRLIDYGMDSYILNYFVKRT